MGNGDTRHTSILTMGIYLAIILAVDGSSQNGARLGNRGAKEAKPVIKRMGKLSNYWA